MAKTEIQAASRSGARAATPTPPARYVALASPRTSAVPSASVSTRMLRKRRRVLTPSNIFGVFLKNRTVVLRHGVYRSCRRPLPAPTSAGAVRDGLVQDPLKLLDVSRDYRSPDALEAMELFVPWTFLSAIRLLLLHVTS